VALYRVAIIGAGPAGYFAAQALNNISVSERSFAIDMFERLPTPWGLVRSGVAPDHPKIKTVSKVFEKIATGENFRLFANVEIGKDLTVEQLQDRYDAVIIATGSSLGRRLGIPGENLRGSLSAASFVPWYNAHPDFTDVDVPMESDTAVVIGGGNVAMDVARMLELEPKELDPTDTADHAIDAFRNSKIRKVYIAIRRGPEHAAFTSPELRDLPKLEHTNVIINEDEINAAIARVGDTAEKDVRSNLDAMLSIAQNQKTEHDRTIEFLFSHSPKEIQGNKDVQEIVFSTSKGEITINCGLVVSAIGYNALDIPGIPFENGKVANIDGRVKGNMYVVGWAKRGPSGVIGTNKSDATAVIELLNQDLSQPKNKDDISELLKGKKVVTQKDWEAINAAEIAAGEPLSKPRRKGITWDDLMKHAEIYFF
jgi:ferredoxin--NADP+ reductase